jgi:Asp-tRNA(Asn)/Glu-tRNA(Gln) amidotransferase A subunit family amidase
VTTRQLGAAFARRALSPTELAERVLEAAGRLAPLHLFLGLDAEAVRAQARASTARWAVGRPRSLVDGVPLAVKDQFDVCGLPTTCGTGAPAGRARRDAAAVARLRDEGAVVVGKTNLCELALGPTGLNPHHGASRNPWDPERDPGGSSAGSAAAVAAGVVSIALGSDLGGSLRIPASYCGVASLKGTYGLVPVSGMAPIAPSLDHAGPLGATVADVRLAHELLTGAALGAPELGAHVQVGVDERWWDLASPAVVRAALEAIGALVRDGASVRPIHIEHVQLAVTAGSVVTLCEAARSIPVPARHLSAPSRISLALGRRDAPPESWTRPSAWWT